MKLVKTNKFASIFTYKPEEMDLNLNGKRAVVCGSTQGIGKACAIELASLGAAVILVSRNQEKLQEILKELPAQSGQQHDFIVADFSNPNDVQKKIEKFAEIHKVHILVNNTGGPPPGKAIDATLDEFRNAFTNHLICNQVLVQALVNGMIQEGYGRIINIISTSVKIPIKGLGVSNTIRSAVANWSKTLSMELGGYGITVNNVLPGATMTGRFQAIIKGTAEKSGTSIEESTRKMISEIPAGRIANPQEVAAAVAFLATPAASYINGINLPVDGGRTGTL
jgi:3-oxoacyl-[acyl-carrier protein] reductase